MIVLVVFGHSLRGLYESNLLPKEVFQSIDSRIYAFHMPVFFALSGFFYLRSIENKPFSKFLLVKFRRFIWPILIWTYLFLIIKYLAGENTNNPISASDIFVSPIPGILHFWFLWAIFVINILFYPISSISKFKKELISFLIMLSIALQFFKFDFIQSKYLIDALRYSPYFLLGAALFNFHFITLKYFQSSWVLITIFCTLLFLYPEFIKHSFLNFFSSFLLAISAILLFKKIDKINTELIPKWLSYLGMISMPIYLTHTIFSAATREILKNLSFHDVYIHLILGTISGLIGPIIVYKLSVKTGAKNILGF